MLPESAEAKQIRNKIHKEMRITDFKDREKARQEAGGSNLTEDSIQLKFGSFYNLLIVKPESKDCYEAIAVLNFNGFPYEVEEENWRGQVSHEFGFQKEDEYPMLMIDSDTPDMPS